MQKNVENLWKSLKIFLSVCVPEFFHSFCYARNMYAVVTGDVESIIDKKRIKVFFLIWFTLFYSGCSLPLPDYYCCSTLVWLIAVNPGSGREEAAENLMRHEVTLYSCGW